MLTSTRKPLSVRDERSLKEMLIGCVESYLRMNNADANPAMKLFRFVFNGMGEAGRACANSYLPKLRASSADDEELFRTVFSDIFNPEHSDHHELATGTNLRTALAEVLCEYKGINREKIKQKADSIMHASLAYGGAGTPVFLVSSSVAKLRAMSLLIQEVLNDEGMVLSAVKRAGLK